MGPRLEILLLTGLVQAETLLSGLPEGSLMLALSSLGEPLLLDRFLYVRVHTDSGIVGLGESGTWGQLEASAASTRTTRRLPLWSRRTRRP